jgi:hypothetical protein
MALLQVTVAILLDKFVNASLQVLTSLLPYFLRISVSSALYVVWSQSLNRRRSRSAPRVGRPRIVITFWPAQWIRYLHALLRYVVDIHIDEGSSHLFNEAISRSGYMCVDTLDPLLARLVDSYRLNSWSRLKSSMRHLTSELAEYSTWEHSSLTLCDRSSQPLCDLWPSNQPGLHERGRSHPQAQGPFQGYVHLISITYCFQTLLTCDVTWNKDRFTKK